MYPDMQKHPSSLAMEHVIQHVLICLKKRQVTRQTKQILCFVVCHIKFGAETCFQKERSIKDIFLQILVKISRYVFQILEFWVEKGDK